MTPFSQEGASGKPRAVQREGAGLKGARARGPGPGPRAWTPGPGPQGLELAPDHPAASPRSPPSLAGERGGSTSRRHSVHRPASSRRRGRARTRVSLPVLDWATEAAGERGRRRGDGGGVRAGPRGRARGPVRAHPPKTRPQEGARYRPQPVRRVMIPEPLRSWARWRREAARRADSGGQDRPGCGCPRMRSWGAERRLRGRLCRVLPNLPAGAASGPGETPHMALDALHTAIMSQCLEPGARCRHPQFLRLGRPRVATADAGAQDRRPSHPNRLLKKSRRPRRRRFSALRRSPAPSFPKRGDAGCITSDGRRPQRRKAPRPPVAGRWGMRRK